MDFLTGVIQEPCQENKDVCLKLFNYGFKSAALDQPRSRKPRAIPARIDMVLTLPKTSSWDGSRKGLPRTGSPGVSNAGKQDWAVEQNGSSTNISASPGARAIEMAIYTV